MITVYVPRDAAALSVGADEVALAIAAEAHKQNKNVKIIRKNRKSIV